MGSGNWIVDNLNSALATWNEKLTEIWTLISTSPEEFKGGGIWDVILNIHDALRAIGYALLVLFFVAGVVKTCGSFTELKRPEVAVKTFVRFALAQGAVTYGLELMMALFSIAQGAVSTIMDASGLTAMSDTALPDEMVTIIEDVGFLESIPLWAVTLLGSLFIWVLSLVMSLTVYSRFFKLYMATAIAPIPLASFAGQPSSSIGVAFVKSYAAICLEGCSMMGRQSRQMAMIFVDIESLIPETHLLRKMKKPQPSYRRYSPCVRPARDPRRLLNGSNSSKS